jgi:hypothetical protein
LTARTAVDFPANSPALPAEYYRRHAARARQLASEATTAAVKEHLRAIARGYERLAECPNNGTLATGPESCAATREGKASAARPQE